VPARPNRNGRAPGRREPRATKKGVCVRDDARETGQGRSAPGMTLAHLGRVPATLSGNRVPIDTSPPLAGVPVE